MKNINNEINKRIKTYNTKCDHGAKKIIVGNLLKTNYINITN